jgi:hypothetical protein
VLISYLKLAREETYVIIIYLTVLSRASGEIKDGILQRDKLFTSSSAAATIAMGYSVSGSQQWKTDKDESLKSFETNN